MIKIIWTDDASEEFQEECISLGMNIWGDTEVIENADDDYEGLSINEDDENPGQFSKEMSFMTERTRKDKKNYDCLKLSKEEFIVLIKRICPPLEMCSLKDEDL